MRSLRSRRSTRRSRLPDTQRTPEAPDPPGLERALAAAYVYLGKRERTVTEVRAHLERAAITARDVDATIAELRDLGYLDDARYARIFVQDKRSLEEWGTERIARSLAGRGIERDVIAAALGEDSAATDREQAIELLRRRFPDRPSDLRDRERALGVLMRKGYDSEIAYEAVRTWSATAAARL